MASVGNRGEKPEHAAKEVDLPTVLQNLAEAAPGASAYSLRKSSEPPEEGFQPETLEALFQEYRTGFEAAVEEIGERWGEPGYLGAVDDPEFPAWSEALLLATWDRGEATAYVGLRHDDDTEPMFIELGAVTREEIATLLVTRANPARGAGR